MSDTRDSSKFEYKTTGGYDKVQVDSFINEVKKYIASQKNEKNLLTQKLQVLATKIKEYQQLEKNQGSLKDSVEQLKQTSVSLQTKNATLQSKNEQLFGDVAHQQEKLASLSKEREQLSLEVAELQRSKAELEAEVMRLSGIASDSSKLIRQSQHKMLFEDLNALKMSVAAGIDEMLTKYEAAEPENLDDLSDEQLRSARNAAKEVLREMTGEEYSEDNTTKLMPDDVDKIELSSEASVDVVINAPGESAPSEEVQHTDADFPINVKENSNALNWDSFKEIESDSRVAEDKETNPVGLTTEEASNLSYDDALKLVLKKNNVPVKEESVEEKTDEGVTNSSENDSFDADAFSETQTNLKLSEASESKKSVPEKKEKHEKGGFFAAIRDSISSILNDDDEEEQDNDSSASDGTASENNEETIRFGK